MKPMSTSHDRRTASAASSSSVPVGDDVRFRVLFDLNPAAVLWLDPQAVIVDANPALQPRFGHMPAALRGQPLSLLMPDWDRPDLLSDLAQRPQPLDATLRHAQGRRCEVVAALLPAPPAGADADGGYFLVVRDVGVQRRLQRRMQVQAEILARTRDAVVALDERGEVVCWNAAAEGLYGASAQAMAGQRLDALFDASERARLHQAVAEAAFGASTPTGLDLRRTGPQGQQAVLRLSLSRMAGVGAGQELCLVLGQDITVPARQEHAARSAAVSA